MFGVKVSTVSGVERSDCIGGSRDVSVYQRATLAATPRGGITPAVGRGVGWGAGGDAGADGVGAKPGAVVG